MRLLKGFGGKGEGLLVVFPNFALWLLLLSLTTTTN